MLPNEFSKMKIISQQMEVNQEKLWCNSGFDDYIIGKMIKLVHRRICILDSSITLEDKSIACSKTSLADNIIWHHGFL